MIFSDLLTYCKLKAIESFLSPTEETIWRNFTRVYSEKWNVPLPEVRKMDPEQVILDVLESRYEQMDLVEEIESILEDILKIENPSYSKVKEVEVESFASKVEQREKNRLVAAQRKDDERLSKRTAKEQPKTGSVDFSKLKDDK